MARSGQVLNIAVAICLGTVLAALWCSAVAAAAPLIVTNNHDNGPGSLRSAIEEASPGNTITAPAGDYALTSGELAITKSLTIQGAGARTTILDGSGKQ